MVDFTSSEKTANFQIQNTKQKSETLASLEDTILGLLECVICKPKIDIKCCNLTKIKFKE